MRFKFDKKKSVTLRQNPKRRIGFEEAREVLVIRTTKTKVWITLNSIAPSGGQRVALYSVVSEVRKDNDGEYYHLVTLWKATAEEEKRYEETL